MTLRRSLALAFILMLPVALLAQPGGRRGRGPGGAGPGSRGPSGELPLKAGDAFPEISIFDAHGKRFSTQSLKGKYSVVVNGCLT